jgi:redox-regulated HSP33 family molecular chaperone
MNKKENFLKKDRILKAVTSDKFFRISVVKTTDVVREAQKKAQSVADQQYYTGQGAYRRHAAGIRFKE